MSTYEEYRTLFANSSDEETLSMLRMESKRLLPRLIGFASLISELVEKRGVPQMPDDFNRWCGIVLENAHELADLIDATAKTHRLEWQQERAKRDLELGQLLWKDAQRGLPELQPYSSLKDAIEQTAKDNNLSFVGQPDHEIRIEQDFLAPGGIIYFWSSERRAYIGTQKRDYSYTGYALAVQWLTDARNMKWDEYECLAPSLVEGVIVLHSWLVEGWSLSKLIDHHPWMTQGNT